MKNEPATFVSKSLYRYQGYTTIEHLAETIASALKVDGTPVRPKKVKSILDDAVGLYEDLTPVATHC